ncbi:MAG: hypothetical protein IJC85_06500, partial [Oscillospiraceae bacterium]|nr:hypothetical protein [Oscillospiraceae bacterium]
MKKLLSMLLSFLLLCSLPFSLSAGADSYLYHQDFSNLSAGSALPEGYETKGSVSVKDGYIEIAAGGMLLLPANLTHSDFVYEVDFTITDAAEGTRWAGFIFHAKGSSAQSVGNYMQMCCRQDATRTNGLEVAACVSGGWKYPANYSESYTEPIDKNKKYTAKIMCTNNKVALSLFSMGDPSEKIFVLANAEVIGEGRFGMQANGSKLRVYGVRISESVTLPGKISNGSEYVKNVYLPTTGIVAPPTVIRVMDSAEDRNSLKNTDAPQVALFDDSTSLEEAFSLCGTKVIPMFRIQSMDKAKELLSYVQKNSQFDLIAASDNSEILKYFYSKEPTAIRLAYWNSGKNDVKDLVKTVWQNNATLLITEQSLSRSDCEYLQKRFVSVWCYHPQLKNGGSAVLDESITKAALDCGANGIFVSDQATPYALYKGVKDVRYCRRPIINAHRGANTIAPENTVEAMIEAAKAGADVVECDVWVTKDNQLVINHNGNIRDYVSDKNPPADSIENHTRAEIKKYTIKAKNNYKNCKFAFLDEMFEVLQDYPNLVLDIEIKTANTNVQKLIADLAKEYGVEDQIISIAFGGSQAKLMHDTMPIGVGKLHSGLNGTTTEVIFQAMKIVGASGSVFNPDCYSMNKEKVYGMLSRGISTNLWTINGDANMRAYATMGSSSITTDQPASAYQLFVTELEGCLNADDILYGKNEDPTSDGNQNNGENQSNSSNQNTNNGTAEEKAPSLLWLWILIGVLAVGGAV